MAFPEHQFQEAVNVFLRRALPPSSWWTSIDHARKATSAQRIRQHARGVRAGIPDMCIEVEGLPTIWIELKAPGGGVVSAHQEQVGNRLLALGRTWGVADSLEGVQAILESAGVQLRARVEDRPVGMARPTKKRASKPRADRPTKRALAFARVAHGVGP